MKIILSLLASLFPVLSIYSCHFADRTEPVPMTEINFSLPRPTGPFAVGRQLIYLSDEKRTAAGKPRPVTAWIYYPAAAVEARSAEETVLPPAWANAYRPSLEKRLGPSAAAALLSVKTSARTDAAPAAGQQSFPVLIFAPGANWLPTDYSSIIEELAGHGHIVIAFASAPLSPFVQLADGSVTASARVDESTYGTVGDDFRFIAGRLESLNRDKSLKIANRFDLGKIGALGHSIGGAAAVAAAAGNPQFTAAVNLDGDYVGAAAGARPAQPIFYLTTEPPDLAGAPIEKWDEDRSEKRRLGVWEQISGGSKLAVRVRAATMFHTNFQDAALLPPAAVPASLRSARFGSIDGARGVRLTTELVRAFFDAQFNARPLDDFQKLEKQYPELKFEIKSGSGEVSFKSLQ